LVRDHRKAPTPFAGGWFFCQCRSQNITSAEAQKVESTLRKVGLGKQVDDAILSMNRAAEDAAKSAAPIFMNAIKQMSFQDAWVF
jgi:hypothetical protein